MATKSSASKKASELVDFATKKPVVSVPLSSVDQTTNEPSILVIGGSDATELLDFILVEKAPGKAGARQFHWIPDNAPIRTMLELPKHIKTIKLHGSLDSSAVMVFARTNYDASPQDSTTSKPGVKGIVESRCQKVIDSLLKLDVSVLTEAAKAPSDLAVLSHLLCRPEVASLPLCMDPLVAARLRGFEQKQKLLQSDGGSKTTAEIASMLQLSSQAITKRRKEGKMIAVELGTKGFHYPVWQLDLPGLNAVLKVMRDRDGWEKLSFFLNPNDALEAKRPLDALRRKQIPVELVVEAAKAYGEQGA